MGSVTFSHYIKAKDRGEAERHRLAREGLVAKLVSDPRTQRRFVDLRKQTGLAQKAAAVRRAITRTAPNSAPRKKADTAFVEGINRQGKKLLRSMTRFTADLFPRPVPWLAADLLMAFLADLGGRAYGRADDRRSTVEPTAVPVRRFIFQPAPGLTAAQRKRLGRQALDAYERALAQDAPALPRRGRVPDKKAAIIVRNAVWYYCHVCQGIYTRDLAAAYHAATHRYPHGQHVSDHPLIRRGIKETARLLNLPLPRSLRTPQ